MLSIILTIILTLNTSFACDNVQEIKQGVPAKCDGWLIKESQMQKFTKTYDEHKLLTEKSALLEQRKVLTDIELDIYKSNNKQLQKEVSRMEDKAFYSNIGYFVLGVLMTGFAAKVAIESSK